MDLNEIKKDLYKSKAMAKFEYYCHGSLYYRVEILGYTYEFPISTIEDALDEKEVVIGIKLSSDLGTTAFENEIRGSELIRWIKKAIDDERFTQLRGRPDHIAT